MKPFRGNLVTLSLCALLGAGGGVALSHALKDSKCESAYIKMSAAELCHATASCRMTFDDVEQYLRARRVYSECKQ